MIDCFQSPIAVDDELNVICALSTQELFQLGDNVGRLGNYFFCQIFKLFSGDKFDVEGFLLGLVQQCRVVEGFDKGSANRFDLIRSRTGRSHRRP